MSTISHRLVGANGLHIHVAEAGAGPLVLLLHGFPDLWYTWRHLLPVLARSGYRAIAPDLRGYGETEAPSAVEDYGILNMIGDVVGLVDALGADSVVLAGHDWGARIAWHTAQLHPQRVSSVIELSVPFAPGPPPPQ